MISYDNFCFSSPNVINFMKTFRKKISGKFEKKFSMELNFRTLQKECER